MKTKILMFNDRSQTLSGAEVIFHHEKELLRSRPDTRVVTFCIENRSFQTRASVDSFIYTESASILINKLAKITCNPRLYRTLRRFIAQERPDIIYIHKNSKYPATVLAACKGYEVIQRVHDYGLICPTGWCVHKDDLALCRGGLGAHCMAHCTNPLLFAFFYAPFFTRRAALIKKHVRRLLCPSQPLTSIVARYFPGQAAFVPNPVDLSTFTYQDAEPAANIVLFAGLLETHKGVHNLIDAMSCIRERVPDAQLRIVGDGSQRQALEVQVEAAGLGDAVAFVGRKTHDAMISEYRSAKVFVLPSIWAENSPTVLHEALALGVPCAGADRGGIPELLGNGEHGELFAPNNPYAMAESICTLLTNAELRRAYREKGNVYIRGRAQGHDFLKQFSAIMQSDQSG